MAAGLGFKDFTTGEVLTAADVDGYLMQGVWVFASAAARDAAVTSPQEGNFAYLKDTNVTTYYTGSAWANLDTTGMTNPMTTTGDTIYSSSGSTPARLGIGTTGQVLTVAGGLPSWATPAGGSSALTKITSGSFSAISNLDLDSLFNSTYKRYMIVLSFQGSNTGALKLRMRVSSTTQTAADWYGSGFAIERGNGTVNNGQAAATSKTIITDFNGSNLIYLYFTRVGNTSEIPYFFGTFISGPSQASGHVSGLYNVANTYTGINLETSTETITGSYQVFGLEN